MGTSPRYFIAVALPYEAKLQLAEWCEPLKNRFRFRKWVHEQDFHITVKYLGECSKTQLEQIRARLVDIQSSEQIQSFTLHLEKFGFFGQQHAPRILWAGVQGDLDALQRLRDKVELEMTSIGFSPENRPYRPHATLAKNYQGSINDNDKITSLWMKQNGVQTSSWSVQRVVLYRTDLSQQPMYVNEGEFPF